MSQEIHTLWRESLKSFSKVSDGFWIIGYTKEDRNKFAFGHAEDPALDDALVLPEFAARQWAETQDSNEKNEV